MQKYLYAVLALLLCSCSVTTQTQNPAVSYAATEIYRGKDGSLAVFSDRSLVYHSSSIAIPTSVLCGLKAHVTKTGAAYACFVLVSKYEPKPSAFSRSPDDYQRDIKERPFTRAALDAAAGGAGLTIPLPQWHTQQTFSAAFVRGFLQKVDETRSNPAAAKITE